MINFEGLELKPEMVIGCSDLKTFKTGSSGCDWQYGFDIYCNGNTIPFHIGMRGYGHVGGPTREEYKGMIMDKRKEFLNIIENDNPNPDSNA